MTKLLKVLVINFVCFFLISCGGSSESNDCITKYRSETTFVSSFVPQAIQYSEELLTKENNSCSPHLFIGTPYNSDQLLCREGFAAGYNYTDKIADWSSYMLTKESVTASFPRTDNYTVDHEIPPYAQSASSDYTNTALDRGHLVPVAAIDFSVKSVEESYYMSNIVPQHLSLNRGLWAGIEQWVRDCTVEVGKLFVYTGVINTSKEEMIGNSVQVPDFFYKIIIKPSSPAQSIAFLIPNVDPNGSDMSEYITSLETIERLTGSNFLLNVKEDIASQMRGMTAEICEIENYDGLIETFETVTVQTPYEYCSESDEQNQPNCCRVCTTGKACGDSCINSSYSCTKSSGCACNS